jgi:3-dehydroquinate synthase
VSSLSFTVAGVTTIVEFVPPPLAPAADLVVADTTTSRLLGGGAREVAEIPPGEKAKIWQSVSAILARCAGLGLGRDCTLAGVGGGVVCDVTAFAASLYMRGCGLILAPTTLLAMVDASLGGKTGIDFLGFKNLVGTFYPASRILICADVLRGLPEREYRSGLAEVIKSAVIGDTALFSLLEGKQAAVLARDPAVIEEMIRRSLSVKGRIVEEDPRESGKRAFLNLGHTFGHALESATGFAEWTHGEAVAWGMGRALAAGVRLGITDGKFAGRVRDLLKSYGYRLEAGVGINDLSAAILRDKKRKAGKTRIVLAAGMESMLLREVSHAELGDALAADVV